MKMTEDTLLRITKFFLVLAVILVVVIPVLKLYGVYSPWTDLCLWTGYIIVAFDLTLLGISCLVDKEETKK